MSHQEDASLPTAEATIEQDDPPQENPLAGVAKLRQDIERLGRLPLPDFEPPGLFSGYEEDPSRLPFHQERIEALVRAWIASLNERNFHAYAALHTDRFVCVELDGELDRALNRNLCLKERKKKLGQGTEVELIETGVLDVSKPGPEEKRVFAARKSSRGVLVEFPISVLTDDTQEFSECLLEIVEEAGKLKIDIEVITVIDLEQDNDEPEVSDCSVPPEWRRHCVLLSTPRKSEKRRKALVKRLRDEGYDAYIEAFTSEVAITLTPAQLERLFKARFIYRMVAASSRDANVCNAYVSEDLRIPKRYQADIESVAVGHQICEEVYRYHPPGRRDPGPGDNRSPESPGFKNTRGRMSPVPQEAP